MSVETQITRLIAAKEAIAAAIEAKGVSVPTTATLDTYASYIAGIPTTSQMNKFKNSNFTQGTNGLDYWIVDETTSTVQTSGGGMSFNSRGKVMQDISSLGLGGSSAVMHFDYIRNENGIYAGQTYTMTIQVLITIGGSEIQITNQTINHYTDYNNLEISFTIPAYQSTSTVLLGIYQGNGASESTTRIKGLKLLV